MSKELHIIYYGTDGDAAKALSKELHSAGASMRIHHAEVWDGSPHACDRVTIMPDVSGHDAGRIRAAYGEKVAQATVPLPAVPIPDVPVILPPAPVPARTPNRR